MNFLIKNSTVGSLNCCLKQTTFAPEVLNFQLLAVTLGLWPHENCICFNIIIIFCLTLGLIFAFLFRARPKEQKLPNLKVKKFLNDRERERERCKFTVSQDNSSLWQLTTNRSNQRKPNHRNFPNFKLTNQEGECYFFNFNLINGTQNHQLQ